jgi:hypothetical protein
MDMKAYIAILALGLPLTMWAQPDWVTVAERTQALVRNPAGDLVRLNGAALTFERRTEIVVAVRFDGDHGSTTRSNPNQTTRLTIYKWNPRGTETDCTNEPCWIELHQLSDYQSPDSSYKTAVKTGDRLLLSVFDPVAGMTRGGDPTELRRDGARYYNTLSGAGDPPGSVYLQSDSVSVAIRPAKSASGAP